MVGELVRPTARELPLPDPQVARELAIVVHGRRQPEGLLVIHIWREGGFGTLLGQRFALVARGGGVCDNPSVFYAEPA